MNAPQHDRSRLAGIRQIEPLIEARLDDGRSYGVCFVPGLLDAPRVWRSLLGQRRALLIAPREVWHHYGPRVAALQRALGSALAVEVMDLDEAGKSLETVAAICEASQRHELGRADALIALGGGVCSDVVGVAASLIRRGIAYVRIPTTLIGQIDAGVGIKAGINFRGAKSYLGSFKPPEIVLLDPSFLPTSPLRSVLDGIAETIKIALICDPHLLELVEQHGRALVGSRFAADAALVREVVSRAARCMVEQLAPNFFEDRTWLRLVDLGHTFSGLVEARSDYRTSHGEAVAIDMALSSAIAVTLGIATPAAHRRLTSLLHAVGLPVDSPLLTVELCEAAVHSACLHRGGAPNLVVPVAAGDCRFVTDRDELTPALFASALALLRQRSLGATRRPDQGLAGA